jgi:hypothetical protein
LPDDRITEFSLACSGVAVTKPAAIRMAAVREESSFVVQI